MASRGRSVQASGRATEYDILFVPQLLAWGGRALRKPDPIDMMTLDPDLVNNLATRVSQLSRSNGLVDDLVAKHLTSMAAPAGGPGVPIGEPGPVALVADTAETLVPQANLLLAVHPRTYGRPAAVVNYNASAHAESLFLGPVVQSSLGAGLLPMPGMIEFYAPQVASLLAQGNGSAASATFLARLSTQMGIEAVPEGLVLELVGYPTAFIRERLGVALTGVISAAHRLSLPASLRTSTHFRIPPGTLRQGYLYTVELVTYASEGVAMSWQLASTTIQGGASLSDATAGLGWALGGDAGVIRAPLLGGAGLLLYVNAPPWNGGLTMNPVRPRALLSRVNITSSGWLDDGALQVRPAGLRGAAAVWRTLAVRYPLPYTAVRALVTQSTFDPASVCTQEGSVLSAPAPITAQYLEDSALGVALYQMAAGVGLPPTDACRRILAGVAQLQVQQPLNATGVLPERQGLRHSVRMQLLLPTLRPSGPTANVTFFSNGTSSSGNRTGGAARRRMQLVEPAPLSAIRQPDLFYEPEAAAAIASSLASVTSFVGLPLGSFGPLGNAVRDAILAGPSDSSTACDAVNASIVAYAVDEEGGVSVRERVITLLPLLDSCVNNTATAQDISAATLSFISDTKDTSVSAPQMIGAAAQLSALVTSVREDGKNATQQETVEVLQTVRGELLRVLTTAVNTLSTDASARTEGVVDDGTVVAAVNALTDITSLAPQVEVQMQNATSNVTNTVVREATNLLETIDTLVTLAVPTNSETVSTTLAPLPSGTGTNVLGMISSAMNVFISVVNATGDVSFSLRNSTNSTGGFTGVNGTTTNGTAVTDTSLVEVRHLQAKEILGKLASALVRSTNQTNAQPVSVSSPPGCADTCINLTVARVNPDPTNPRSEFKVGTGEGKRVNSISIPSSAILNAGLESVAVQMTTYGYMPYNPTAGNRDKNQYNVTELVERNERLMGIPAINISAAVNRTAVRRSLLTRALGEEGAEREAAGHAEYQGDVYDLQGNLLPRSGHRVSTSRRLSVSSRASSADSFRALLAGRGDWKPERIEGDQAADRPPASQVNSATVLGLDGTDVKLNTETNKARRRQLLSSSVRLPTRRVRALSSAASVSRSLAEVQEAPADPLTITIQTSCAPDDMTCKPGVKKGLVYTIQCPSDSTLVLDPPVFPLGRRFPALVTYFGQENGFVGQAREGEVRFAGQTQVNYTAAIDPDLPNQKSETMLQAEEAEVPFKVHCGATAEGDENAERDPETGETLITTVKPVYVFSVECGEGVGQQNFTCGPGFYDSEVNYECPTLINAPTCRFWDERQRKWAGEGCTVASVDSETGAVTCECTHLTDFSARFAALAKQQEEMFAMNALLANPCIFSAYPWLFIIIGSMASILVGLALIGQVADTFSSVTYYSSLLQDEEIAFVHGLTLMRGGTFMLDRYLDKAAEGVCACMFRCCFPRVQKRQLASQTAAESVSINLRASRRAMTDTLPQPEKKSAVGCSQALTVTNPMAKAGSLVMQASMYRAANLMQKRQSLKRALASARAQTSTAAGSSSGTSAKVKTMDIERKVARVLALQDLVTTMAVRSGGTMAPTDKIGATMYVTLVENFDRLRVSHEKLGVALPEPEEQDVIIPDLLKIAAAVGGKVRDWAYGLCGLCLRPSSACGRRSSSAAGGSPEGGLNDDSFQAANPMYSARAGNSVKDPMALELPPVPVVDDGSDSDSSTPASTPKGSAAAAGGRKAPKLRFAALAMAAVEQAKMEAELDPPGKEAAEAADVHDPEDAQPGSAADAPGGKGTGAGMMVTLPHLERSVTRASQRLVSMKAWTCTRAWQLRKFLCRMWYLKVLYSHPILSVLVKFDPKMPRTIRLLAFGVNVLTALWAATFLYAFKDEGGDEAFDFSAAIVTGVFAAFLQFPINMFVNWLLEETGELEYQWRYPSLARDMQNRKKSAERLRKLDLETLEARVKRLQALQVELGILNPGTMTAVTRPVAVATAIQDRDSAAAKAKSRAERDRIAAAKDLTNLTDAQINEDADGLGWRDPPRSCVRLCCPLVYACNRHPWQKRAWVLRKLELKKAKAIKRVEKREAKKAKKLAKLAAQARAAGAVSVATANSGALIPIPEDGVIAGAVPGSLVRFNDTPAEVGAGAALRQLDTARSVGSDMENGGQDTEREEGDLPRLDSEADVMDAPAPSNARVSRLAALGKSMRAVAATVEAQTFATVATLGGLNGPVGMPSTEVDDDDDMDDGADGDGGGDALDELLEGIATSEDFGEVIAEIFVFVLNVVIIAWVVHIITWIQRKVIMKIAEKVFGIKPEEEAPTTTAATASEASARVADADPAKGQSAKDDITRSTRRTHPTMLKVRQALEEKSFERGKDEAEEAEESEFDPLAPPADCARRCCPCGTFTIGLYAFVLVWTAWTLYYTLLFGLCQTREVTEKMLIDFGISQIIALCLVHPGLTLIAIVFGFIVKPAWLPCLSWIPKLGAVLLGPNGALGAADPDAPMPPTVLTGRLQNLTLIRAAGAVSMLPPDSAIIAFGVTSTVTGILNGMTNRKLRSQNKSKQEAAEAEASNLAVSQYKQELAVQSYCLEQLLLAHAHKVASGSQTGSSTDSGSPPASVATAASEAAASRWGHAVQFSTAFAGPGGSSSASASGSGRTGVLGGTPGPATSGSRRGSGSPPRVMDNPMRAAALALTDAPHAPQTLSPATEGGEGGTAHPPQQGSSLGWRKSPFRRVGTAAAGASTEPEAASGGLSAAAAAVLVFKGGMAVHTAPEQSDQGSQSKARPRPMFAPVPVPTAAGHEQGGGQGSPSVPRLNFARHIEQEEDIVRVRVLARSPQPPEPTSTDAADNNSDSSSPAELPASLRRTVAPSPTIASRMIARSESGHGSDAEVQAAGPAAAEETRYDGESPVTGTETNSGLADTLSSAAQSITFALPPSQRPQE